MRLNVYKRMGFGRAGHYFWDELLYRLPLLGKRFRAMGGPGCKKVSPCHLQWLHSTAICGCTPQGNMRIVHNPLKQSGPEMINNRSSSRSIAVLTGVEAGVTLKKNGAGAGSEFVFF